MSAARWTRSDFELGKHNHVLLGEAVALARFAQSFWKPVADPVDKNARPGLAQVGPQLPPSVVSDILEQQYILQTANTRYLLTVAPLRPHVRTRAEHTLSELMAALE